MEQVNSSQKQRKDKRKKLKKQCEAVEQNPNSSLKTDAVMEEADQSQGKEVENKDTCEDDINLSLEKKKVRKKKRQKEADEHTDGGSCFSLDDSPKAVAITEEKVKENDVNAPLKIDAITKKESSPPKPERTKKKKKEGEAVEYIDPGTLPSAANSPHKIDTTIEEVTSLGKRKRGTKMKKQGTAFECNDNYSLDNSSPKIDSAAEEVSSVRKQKREQKEKQNVSVENKDKGPHVSLDNSSLKIDATTEEVNLSPKQEKTKRRKKEGKAVEHIDLDPHLLSANSPTLIDATIEEEISLGKREMAIKRKKQGKSVECNDKVPKFSLDYSSLKIDFNTEEVSSPGKGKRERKENQHESVELKDKDLHVSLDNPCLKIDATTDEVNMSLKQKREKKKKGGKVVEHIDQGHYLLATNCPLNINAMIEYVNSPQNLKSEIKEKQGKSFEPKEEGPHVSLDNSSLKADATAGEVTKRAKTKKKGKAIEHEDNTPQFSVYTSSQKTHATIEDPLHEFPALPNLLSSQRIIELSSTKIKPCPTMLGWTHGFNETIVSCPAIDHVVCPPKKKSKKKRKTKHDGIENNFNCCGAPDDKTSTLTLHMPSEHPIQSVPTDPIARQCCVEIDICQGEKEENERCAPKKATESCNVECRVQEGSCSRNSVMSNAVCSVKEATLEGAKFNICWEKKKAKELSVPKKVAENSTGECHVQEVSCTCNSVVSNAECSAKDSMFKGVRFNTYQQENKAKEQCMPVKVAESSSREHHTQEVHFSCHSVVSNSKSSAIDYVSEVVELNKKQGKINYNADLKDNRDLVKNARPAKHHDGYRRNGCCPISSGRTITCNSNKKLIILDVNGLLADFVDRVPKGSSPPDFWVNKKKVYKRPFCSDFLDFCFQKFHVGVWSSRAKPNLNKAIKCLFGKSASKLLFAWNRNQCTKTKYKTLEDKNKPLVLKELKKLWGQESPCRIPWVKGQFNESNTLLLDDSPYKALLNPKYTAIFPHSYHYDNPDDKSLGHGGDIRVYLKGLAAAENVQDYVSSNPFGQEAITETHPSWDFYSEVIEAVKHNGIAANKPATKMKPKGCHRSPHATDQVTTGLPHSATGEPPGQAKAAPPPCAIDLSQKTQTAPPSGTRDPPRQTKALVPPAMRDPPQQTKAPVPPTTEDPLQLNNALHSPTTSRKAMPCPVTEEDPQQNNAMLPPAGGNIP